MSPAPVVHLDDIADKMPIMDDGKLVKVEVRKAEVRVGKESGNPYINLEMEVKDDEEDEGTVMFDVLTMPLEIDPGENPKAYKKRMDRRCFKLKQAATAFKITTAGGCTQEELAEKFVARQCWVSTKIETSEGRQDRNVVTAYYALDQKPA